jgi:hypothetical protein
MRIKKETNELHSFISQIIKISVHFIYQSLHFNSFAKKECCPTILFEFFNLPFSIFKGYNIIMNIHMIGKIFMKSLYCELKSSIKLIFFY